MPSDPTLSPRAGVLVIGLVFVGALTLITSCSRGNDAYSTGPGPQVTDADLSGTDVQMHQAVG